MLCLDADPIVLDATSIGVLVAIGVLLLLVVGRELRQVPANLLVLMATAFLDMVGLFMVLPILPFYVQSLQQQGVTIFGFQPEKGLLNGLVVTSYTVAQFLSAPWWGRYSDRHGRRPALLIALAASAGAFLLFGFAESIWVLVLSRIVQGAGGGTVGVIQAYVADAVPPEQRAKALGWLSAATNLGVAFGPVLASLSLLLADVDLWPAAGTQSLGRATPGVMAALLCVVNVYFAWRYLPESREQSQRRQPTVSARVALARVFANPDRSALRLLLTYGIAIGAAQGVNPTLVYFLEDRHGISETTIGYYFMYIGALSVFARVLLIGRAVERLGEAKLSRLGLATLAVGLGTLPFTHSLATLALATALLPLGMALTFPCLTALLSKIVSKDERGMYMGLQQTFGGVARMIAPVAYGVGMDALGMGAPFWLAAGLVAMTLLLRAGGRS